MAGAPDSLVSGFTNSAHLRPALRCRTGCTELQGEVEVEGSGRQRAGPSP